MRKIIFIVYHPFFQRDFHRYGVEFFMGKGYPIEIWYIPHNQAVDFVGDYPLYKGDNYHKYDFQEYKKQVEIHLHDIFVLFDIEERESYEIINHGCKYVIMSGLCGVFQLSDVCQYRVPLRLYESLRRVFQQGFIQSASMIYEKILRKIYMKRVAYAIKKNPAIKILTSTKKVSKMYLKDEILKGNVLYTHALDFDRYIEEEEKKDNRENMYIVFCDSGYGSTGYDFVYCGINNVLDNKKFHTQIDNLLKKMEMKYNIPAVILGHPHSKYENGAFGGRKVIINNTCEYAKKSKMFILNTSTAINFAALYNRPILQVVNSDFKRIHTVYPNAYEHIRYESNIVYGCGFMDMDDKVAMQHPWDYVKPMEPVKRQKFIRDYIIDNDTKYKRTFEYLEENLRCEI